MVPSPILLINGFFIIAVLVLIWRMYQAADIFNKNQGDRTVQSKEKFKILWSLVLLLFIGLLAAAINLATAFFSSGS